MNNLGGNEFLELEPLLWYIGLIVCIFAAALIRENLTYIRYIFGKFLVYIRYFSLMIVMGLGALGIAFLLGGVNG